ncbi:MAG: hypothetical protein ACE14M_07515 [Terriglobales bacterium]
MKLGTENRTRTMIAIVLMLIALALVLRMLFSSSPATAAVPVVKPGVAAPKPLPPRRTTRSGDTKRAVAVLPSSLDPRLRIELLKNSEEVKYEGAGRNIFAEGMAAIPAAQAPGLLDQAKQLPPGPLSPPSVPSPPAIALKFYGWASNPGEPKKIFLAKGGEVFVASEGEVIAGRYKVLRINKNSVDVEDLLSNNRQSIPFTG